MEQSRGLTNANEKGNLESGEIREGEELKKKEIIPGTPFLAIWSEEYGWWAVCGKYRITEHYETLAELIDQVEKRPWEMILAVINIVSIEGLKMNEKIENLNK